MFCCASKKKVRDISGVDGPSSSHVGRNQVGVGAFNSDSENFTIASKKHIERAGPHSNQAKYQHNPEQMAQHDGNGDQNSQRHLGDDNRRSHASPPQKQKIEAKSFQSPHFKRTEITKSSPVKAVSFQEKTQLHCRFCGGKSCKHEDWKLCENPAIHGLHSNWINENVIGSQRLSDRLIHEFDIIKQFKQKGITAIFNLQEPGEHPFCGDGISLRTGFSYTPELLMNNGISFFNCYWKDLTNPSFEQMLNIVQVMDFIIRQGGKVLVHCHAGQGRTASLIGAYLLYAGIAKNDEDAIAITRNGRPKCFSKSNNKRFIKNFFEQLGQLRLIFPNLSHSSKVKSCMLSLKDIMKKQNTLLHGEERRFIRFMPKVIYTALHRFKELQSEKIDELYNPLMTVPIATQQLFKANSFSGSSIMKGEESKKSFQSSPGTGLNKSFMQDGVEDIRNQINTGHWDGLKELTEKPVLLQIIIEYIKGLQKPLLSNEEITALSDISVSAAVDRMHMGLLTALADLISVIINPDNAKTLLLKNEESKKSLMIPAAGNQLSTVNNSQGMLSIQPIKMEVDRDGDSERKEQEHKLGAGAEKSKRIQKYVATAEEEEELYKQMVYLLLTSEQQKQELFVKTLSDQLRLLNIRKEEIYNRDDLREFGSMSPVKKLAHEGLKLKPMHEQDLGRGDEFGNLQSGRDEMPAGSDLQHLDVNGHGQGLDPTTQNAASTSAMSHNGFSTEKQPQFKESFGDVSAQ